MSYPVTTKIERKDGHYFVKTREYGLIKEARLIIMLRYERQLDRYDHVFFIDGDRHNLNPRNLVCVRFNRTRFKYLPKARIIYIPRAGMAKAAA